MKGPAEKNFEGIYANPRLMHSVGQIVGCIVHVHVKNGCIFEGVLRTFSSKADFVLELAQRVDNKHNPSLLMSTTNPDDYYEKIVFSFNDVIMIEACNVDPEFATRETFTDTAISKFNGQVVEKELEVWEPPETLSPDGLIDLGANEEEANGWDAHDMFKTNEEKYGVKSSFDKNLSGYTIPLNKQNTEEYRQKEEKADKMASEIESGVHHKSRAALENGDEEERFSAVVRPDNMNNFRFVPHRQRRSAQNMRNMRNNGTMSHMNRNSHQHTQVYQRVSSPAASTNNSSQGNYRQSNSISSNNSSISPRQTPAPNSRQANPAANQLPVQSPTSSAPGQFQQTPVTASSNQPTTRTTPPTVTPTVPQDSIHKLNGETDKTELKFAPKPPRSLNLHSAANKEMRETIVSQQISNKNADRRKESDKKTSGQKARDEKTEDLKRFHAKFKLSEDPKETHDQKSDTQSAVAISAPVPAKHHKDRQKEEERRTPESRKSPETPKISTLNPNAKEFILNPNAKSFTPRGVPMQNVVPPPVQPPPRLHTQSPIMAMPQPHIMQGMPQTVFNVAPHYVVSATPVSMAQMGPPFTPSASVAQAPRFRKDEGYGLDLGHNQYEDLIFSAMPMTLRHDMTQQVHVQAATGQPILAQPTLSAPQFAIQYATPPGMLHQPGPPQQLTYAPMYPIMPRVLTPQMVPTSAAYGDNPQIHWVSHPSGPSMQHAMNAANNGQHSNSSTPQSQTPNIHPAPSPVHQPPPSGGHGQPPTPTGHPSNAPTPQPVMYSHAHVAAQHQLHANHQSSNQGHPFATSYPGTPQPIVLLQQQPHAPHPVTFASSLQNHLHGQNPGNHVGTPTHHVLQHAPLAMIPTSAGMVHSQAAGHYVPHSQV